MKSVRLSPPTLRNYVLVFIAVACLVLVYAFYRQMNGVSAADSGGSAFAIVRNGLLVTAAVMLTAFLSHLVVSTNAAQPSIKGGAMDGAAATSHTATVQQGARSGSDRTMTLQVRGLGMTIDHFSQSEIWQHLQSKSDPHTSIYSQVASDYPSGHTRREDYARLRTGAAFKAGAGEAVDYWPVPVITVAPPREAGNEFTGGFSIAPARQQAGLAFQIFLWQEDASDLTSGAPIEHLFNFFDANPDVPAALIFSSDGMVLRNQLRKPGSGALPDGSSVPKIFDSNVAMLVVRPDRVDHLVRPYVVAQPDSVDARETQFDIVKMWNFYWDQTDAYDEDYEARLRARGAFPVTPHTMATDWWQKKLPDLWAHTENKGPGAFSPSRWLPVHWTASQLRQFDESPVLGYLHRPVSVPLKTGDHAWMKQAAQAEALRQGWEAAQTALQETAKPERVFFDTSSDRQWLIPLSQALHGSAGAPSPSDPHEGYDLGYRIGNTGVSSGLSAIGLALTAGYFDGKASGAIALGHNGSAEITMITPPSAAEKASNMKYRGDDPFNNR